MYFYLILGLATLIVGGEFLVRGAHASKCASWDISLPAPHGGVSSSATLAATVFG